GGVERGEPGWTLGQSHVGADLSTPRNNIVKREAGRGKHLFHDQMKRVIHLAADRNPQWIPAVTDVLQKLLAGSFVHRESKLIWRRNERYCAKWKGALERPSPLDR